MKKNFYKIVMLLLVSGLLTVSCKKEKTLADNAGPNGKRSSMLNHPVKLKVQRLIAPATDTPAPPSGGCPGTQINNVRDLQMCECANS